MSDRVIKLSKRKEDTREKNKVEVAKIKESYTGEFLKKIL
jgi:hypothetical protein